MKEDRKGEEMPGKADIPTLPMNKKMVIANVDENPKADWKCWPRNQDSVLGDNPCDIALKQDVTSGNKTKCFQSIEIRTI